MKRFFSYIAGFSIFSLCIGLGLLAAFSSPTASAQQGGIPKISWYEIYLNKQIPNQGNKRQVGYLETMTNQPNNWSTRGFYWWEGQSPILSANKPNHRKNEHETFGSRAFFSSLPTNYIPAGTSATVRVVREIAQPTDPNNPDDAGYEAKLGPYTLAPPKTGTAESSGDIRYMEWGDYNFDFTVYESEKEPGERIFVIGETGMYDERTKSDRHGGHNLQYLEVANQTTGALEWAYFNDTIISHLDTSRYAQRYANPLCDEIPTQQEAEPNNPNATNDKTLYVRLWDAANKRVVGGADAIKSENVELECADECSLNSTCDPDFPDCGNGTVDTDEECDDGNTDNGDGCNSQCQNEECGDGVVQAGEWCDDGNTTNGDGCDSTCDGEPECGDGLCHLELGETEASCPQDCAPECGDGYCDSTESEATCPEDCGPVGPVCGDDICDINEDADSCPEDCGTENPECGDNVCDYGEDVNNCIDDCGTCDWGFCIQHIYWCSMHCSLIE